MITVTAAERRHRLARRHALAEPVTSPVDAARAVVALHGTDPATTVLSALARSTADVPEVERALYEERSLVRVLAMRRTVFAVPHELVGTCLAGASAVAAIEAVPEITSAELAEADPLLATRLGTGQGAYAATQSVASRLLTLLSAEGRVVRARPRGGWTSTQFRWAAPSRWHGAVALPDTHDATVALARAWLRAYGPASPDDLQWWTGWTKTRTRSALAALPLVEVDLDGLPGVVLADDVDAVSPPDPWVALLPALDPTAMAWKHRDFVLGPHRGQVFDVNGNAGPTAWVDGRVVGGWAQRDDGEVVVRLLQDVGSEAAASLEQAAERLTTTLGDVRLKARARGWTTVERELRA